MDGLQSLTEKGEESIEKTTISEETNGESINGIYKPVNTSGSNQSAVDGAFLRISIN